MALITNTEEIIRQNLKDAGCGDRLTEEVIRLIKLQQTRSALSLLSKHRRVILRNCRAEQKKIDCLDYLVYQLEKSNF